MVTTMADLSLYEIPMSDMTYEDHLFSLYLDWYEVNMPTNRGFSGYTSNKFADIWTNKWFAKNEKQAVMDAYLKKYETLFDYNPEDVDKNVGPLAQIYMQVALLILWDQVSRNIFRGTPRAYETDKKARDLVEVVMASWQSLPLPVKITCILVYIHSEDKEDLKKVAQLIDEVREPMKAYPGVFQSLQGIATNHRDRMELFGRIPERNKILGRESTEKELAYLSMF